MKKKSSIKLKLGLPKGSLQEATLNLFGKAGFDISISSRSYLPSIDDEAIEPILLRAQEMSRYVESGSLDCGITGQDWIRENNSNITVVANLVYAKQWLRPVKWVLAVPFDSKIKKPKDLKDKVVASELLNTTKEYFAKKKIDVDVEYSWGATEAKVSAGLVDAVVELTETGSSLRANKLRVIDVVCESVTQFIAHNNSWKNQAKRRKMEAIALLLKGAIAAQEKVGLKMNVSQANLNNVLSILPAMRKPTVSNLSQKDWAAVETVIDEKVVRTLIPKLKAAGAEGIIEYPLNKVVP